MRIICKDSSGFEDQLTADKEYGVKELGENSYLVTNDNGEEVWYGTSHFNVANFSL